MAERVLVIDVGTSGVRAAVVDADATVVASHYLEILPSTPLQGFVEFDPALMAAAALDVARAALAEAGSVNAVGIANQRASTIVWDRVTGEPVGPGVGWQDLRTVGTCMMLAADGIRVAPNASATKLGFLLDSVDVDRTRDLCFGTVDSWIAWTLSEGALHVTDLSNAAVTDLTTPDGAGWGGAVHEALRIPASVLPEIVDTSGLLGAATALPGAPPIAALVGDQQASLVGQGAVRQGLGKITFGTGGMLDVCLGPQRPKFEKRGEQGGTFPIVCWRLGGLPTWGVEAAMLSAGTNIEWLRDDLAIIDSAEASHDVASQCGTTGGVVYVPALMGLGAPWWDFGARGTLLGITRGTGRAEIVRAVLEGIAHRGADLVEAAEADTGARLAQLRVDGGMSRNPTFVQALANATGMAVEVSREREATTLGAGLLAGLAVGMWDSIDDLAELWSPAQIVEPTRKLDRDQWHSAVERAKRWDEGLSAIEF